jgi:fumarylacetoacetase
LIPLREVLADGPYGIHHLPYGSVRMANGRRVAAVRVGDFALDLHRLLHDSAHRELFATGSLDPLLAAGRSVWTSTRAAITAALHDDARLEQIGQLLLPLDEVDPVLPFSVADYVDFYASEHHAANVGAIFRPGGEPLTPNWKHMPIGYHGRSGTIVVSGTDIRRPKGQSREPDGSIRFGPSRRLDFEAEVGFVLGGGSPPGHPVTVADAPDYMFGVCLLNDWSARDLQAWEYVPLGPFLGKSFATSLSAWITPLAALDGAWTNPPPRDPRPLPYLDDHASPAALDLRLAVTLNGTTVSRPRYADMYWTPTQMLAHMTVNGAHVRSGDLFGSGTVSGPQREQRGSLLELAWDGTDPITLTDGSTRTFLEDGDEVVLTATAVTKSGPIALGEVRSRVQPSYFGISAAKPDR